MARGTKYVYIKSTTVYAPHRNWDSPNPFLASECSPPPRNRGEGAHQPAGGGLGGVPIPTRGIHCGTLYMYVLCSKGGYYYTEKSYEQLRFTVRRGGEVTERMTCLGIGDNFSKYKCVAKDTIVCRGEQGLKTRLRSLGSSTFLKFGVRNLPN